MFQTQSNAYVAIKKQSGLNSQASGSDALVLRQAGGAGGRLTKAVTASDEVRQDGMRTRGRHGIQKTQGSYPMEWSLGCADEVLAGIMRGAWASADVTLDESDFTSLTTGANTIVLASGDPRALGVAAGRVIRLTNHASAGNNNKNLRVTSVSATTITVAETLTVNATPDTDCEIVIPGRVLINPAAGWLLKEYFTIEEHELDIDGSEIFTDAFWGGGTFRMGPNGILQFEPSWVGTGQFDVKEGVDAPFFSSPVEPTGIPMAVVDATLRLGNTDQVALTSFDVTFGTNPAAPDVFGSGQQKYAPDVFPGAMMVSLNLSMLREDLARVTAFKDETQLSLHVLAVDNESEPKDFLSLMVPNFTLGGVDKSALSKDGGPRTQTLQIPGELVGKDTRGTGYDATMIQFQVSNAA